MKTNYSVPKAVSRYLRRIQFTARSNTLSLKARKYCIFVFECWYSILSDHLPQTSLRHFCNTTENVDVAVFGLLLKDYATRLRIYANSFREDGRMTVTEFEVSVGIPRGYSWLSCIRPQLAEFLEFPTAKLLRLLLQVVEFPTRANVEGVITEEELLAEYVGLEDNYPEQDLSILHGILDDVPDIDPLDIIPAHGPGAVAQGTRSRIDKEYLLFESDLRLEYMYSLLGLEYHGTNMELDRCSKLIFVPKSLWTYRTISAEPAVLQFWQHGVARAIERAFHRSWLGAHIELRDQSLSQDMCFEASIFGEYDTLDLSEASDRVSWESVKLLTSRCPVLRRLLTATRSDYTLLPDGRRIRLKKFAPMGSACAFPIESMFFACVCELAVRKVTGRRGRRDDYRVYGDDIIIKSRYTDTLMDLLDRLGSKINTKKSFSHSCLMNFREACGVEYFNGSDVTPLRFPRFINIDWDSWERNAGPITGLLDFRNFAYSRRFFSLANYIDEFLKPRVPYNYIRRVPVSEWVGGLVIATRDDWATNYQLETRYNDALQRTEYHCLQVRTRPDHKLEGYLGIQSWIHQANRRGTRVPGSRSWIGSNRTIHPSEPILGASDPEVSFLAFGWEA